LSKPPAEAFDYSLATQYAYLAFASYCPVANISAWNCYWCEQSGEIGIRIVGVVYDADSDLQAFVAINQSTVHLVFRGTEKHCTNPSWWLCPDLKHDLDAIHVYPFGNYPMAGVHQGFYDAVMTLMEGELTGVISQAIQECPGCPFHISGHSLGGAMATAFVIALQNISIVGDIVIERVVTFGSPRVFTPDMTELYESYIATTWRVTHDNDCYVHMPFETDGYWHVTQEFWIDGTGMMHTCALLDGEDPSCADRYGVFTEWRSAPHKVYMGLNLNDGASSGC